MSSAYVPQIARRGRPFLVGGLASAEYPIEEALSLKPVSALKDGTTDKLDISQNWCACLSLVDPVFASRPLSAIATAEPSLPPSA